MGLDWMLNRKIREGSEEQVKELDEKLRAVNEEIDKDWSAWRESRGTPNRYTSVEAAEFEKTNQHCLERERLQALLSEHIVSPGEVIGAPRVGIDEVADAWVRDEWDSAVNQMGLADAEEWIKENHGKHIHHLVEECPGLGKITGMLAGPTSFRGKVIGYLAGLPGDLQDRAYKDMSPEELVKYGNELRACVELIEHKDDIQTLLDAASWCVFWGSNGFGMYAWY